MLYQCKQQPWLFAMLLTGLGACQDTLERERIEPSFIEVVVQGDSGSAEDPMPFTSEVVSWTVEVQTLDKNADPYPFNGDLKVRVRPGRLQMDPWVTIVEGSWSGDISFEAGFGPTRIWMADEGDKDQDSGREASWATGVTEPIQYAFPTIAEMQRTDDHETNQLVGEYAELRIEDREVVITWVGTDGFWATDLAEDKGPANHAHLFVYTFSKPDGIVRGSRLKLLKGADQEYLATSQLSFPAYEAFEDEELEVPDYTALDSSFACDDDSMEALESALVEASGLTIPSNFGPGTEDYEDYVEYGQWPADLDGGCTIYVDSSALDDFDPSEHSGTTLDTVRGTLSEVWGKWIIVANSDSDIASTDDGDATARSSLVSRPRPRPRVRPSAEHRDWLLSRPSPPESSYPRRDAYAR